jgi:dolichol-phosphate mannosyltransferase
MAQFDNVSLSILLPVYNESEHIVFFIRTVKEEIEKCFTCSFFEILVIDDNSPDFTWKITEESGIPAVRVIRRMEDRGLARSLADGAEAARGHIVAWMDCDFSQPPSYLPQLIAAVLAGWDIAVNSRYVGCGGDFRKGKYTRLQKLLSSLFNGLAHIVFGYPFYDYTSGFIAIKKETLNELGIFGDYGEYFVDLIARAHAQGKRIIELPYPLETRVSGNSKTFACSSDIFKRGMQYLGQLFKTVRIIRKIKWHRR